MKWMKGWFVGLLCLLVMGAQGVSALTITDSSGREVSFEAVPKRVVSVVPSLTEALFEMGAGGHVVGVTRHDTWPPEAAGKPVVGGFFKPNIKKVLEQAPDLVIVSAIQKELIAKLSGKVAMVQLDPASVEGSFDQILLLGRIMGCEKGAEKIIKENRRILDDIGAKVAKIPANKRKRVLRLMGREKIMTPGADSFQQHLIRLAGGIPHSVKRNGGVIALTDEEFIAFNPDVVYGCGGDKRAAEIITGNPLFKEVSAVKNKRFDWYPCELTCRASTHTGYFVSWLASNIYSKEFSVEADQIHANTITKRDAVRVPLEYVKQAEINKGTLYDFPAKTLVVDFKTPKTILSTLDGWHEKIESVGNHYFPPQCWRLMHEGGFEGMKQEIFKMVGRDGQTSRFLYTGANMDNLAVKSVSYRDMTVTALATAGVCGNAVRMGKDIGMFYEPGTINVLILPNMHLSHRAMSRAVISATEGKSAALDDLDVRSSYTGLVNPATGTGTDNIIVVEGEGVPLENAGGHSKLGELVAKAVYGAVSDAIYKQNGLVADRSVFQRLKDRKLTLSGIIGKSSCPCAETSSEAITKLENLLLEPRYASFIKAAMAISDDYERHLITDLSGFQMWCDEVAREVAGGPVPEVNYITDESIPKPLAMALGALLSGSENRR